MLSIPGLATYGAPSALMEVWAKHVHDLTEIQERQCMRAHLMA
jgi:hypothetical protein